MLDLVTRLDLKLLDALKRALTGLIVGIGKIARDLRKTVYRAYNEALCEIDAHREDHYKESHQDRCDLESERSLDVNNIRH